MTRSHFGSIQRLGPDYYRVFWSEGGERRSARMRCTRDDAELFLARKKLGGLPSTTTWRQLWREVALPQIETLAVRTQEEYRTNWEKHLAPQIADEPVSEMDWHRANEVLTSISAPSVQRQCGKLLKKLCNMAIRDRGHLLTHNPVDRAIQYAPKKKRKKTLVDASQVPEYMEKARGCKYEPVILCLMGFGMRPEEADALLWEDLREHRFHGQSYCVATIDKALVWSHQTGKILKDTKNEPSARDAVCGEPWASRLLELSEGKSGPLVPSGTPYDPSKPEAWYTSPLAITRNWKLWCERKGLPYVNQKDMRSSYATMMGEALVPDSIVAGNMGHGDGTTKGTHYQRVTMRAKCMAADMLAELVEEMSQRRQAVQS